MTIEEHINGLKGIKPYLQKKMLEINYEGLGELDALQVGETMDFAIESIKELETYKKELIVLRKAYELVCKECYGMTLEYCAEHGEDDCEKCHNFEECGNSENLKTYYLNKAKENINGRD